MSEIGSYVPPTMNFSGGFIIKIETRFDIRAERVVEERIVQIATRGVCLVPSAEASKSVDGGWQIAALQVNQQPGYTEVWKN